MKAQYEIYHTEEELENSENIEGAFEDSPKADASSLRDGLLIDAVDHAIKDVYEKYLRGEGDSTVLTVTTWDADRQFRVATGVVRVTDMGEEGYACVVSRSW